MKNTLIIGSNSGNFVSIKDTGGQIILFRQTQNFDPTNDNNFSVGYNSNTSITSIQIGNTVYGNKGGLSTDKDYSSQYYGQSTDKILRTVQFQESFRAIIPEDNTLKLKKVCIAQDKTKHDLYTPLDSMTSDKVAYFEADIGGNIVKAGSQTWFYNINSNGSKDNWQEINCPVAYESSDANGTAVQLSGLNFDDTGIYGMQFDVIE